jgi:hypothetical protein
MSLSSFYPSLYFSFIHYFLSFFLFPSFPFTSFLLFPFLPFYSFPFYSPVPFTLLFLISLSSISFLSSCVFSSFHPFFQLNSFVISALLLLPVS